MSDHEYSQGIMGDGAAILKDGEPMTIEEIVSRLTTAQVEIEALRAAYDDLRLRVVASMDDKRAAARNWPDAGVNEMLYRSASEDQATLDATDYAQRLRQQADEAEKAGGGHG